MEKVNNNYAIVYSISGNYIDILITSIKSLSSNNDLTNIDILILHNYNSIEKINKALKYFKNFDFSINLIYCDLNNYNFPLHGHIDISTYFRLVISKYIDKHYSKVLYIDSDTIIAGDITQLFNTNFGSKSIGAINQYLDLNDNFSNKVFSRLKKLNLDSKNYFNAGVLLIDLEKWNNENVFEKSIEILKNHFELLDWWDQDILNIIFKDKVLFLDPKYNFIKDPMEKIISYSDAKIIHFAGPMKPWYWFINLKNKHLFLEYYDKINYIKFLNFTRLISNLKLIFK